MNQRLLSLSALLVRLAKYRHQLLPKQHLHDFVETIELTRAGQKPFGERLKRVEKHGVGASTTRGSASCQPVRNREARLDRSPGVRGKLGGR